MPFVYNLSHPITKNIYYVGFTTRSLEERLAGHLIIPIHPTTKYLVSVELVPIIEVIESGEYVTKEREMYWIKKLSKEGNLLENRDGIINYQNKDYIFAIPEEMLDSLNLTENERYRIAIQTVLKELPESSSTPIAIRIKTILEWALDNASIEKNA